MDTLGVCGAPSIAADNGVVMVKEPGLERVSENLDSLWTHTESLSDASEQLNSWTDGRMDGWKERGGKLIWECACQEETQEKKVISFF